MSNTTTITTEIVSVPLKLPKNQKENVIGSRQRAVILRAPRQPYELVENWPRPTINNPKEILIRVKAIGLNPVDWKSAVYNFALPTLPALNGRDLAGTIVAHGADVDVSKFKIGDDVFGPSTQYRDYRTSAFQEYAVLPEHCLGKVPSNVSIEQSASIGVGAVTAAIAFGSALGIEFAGFFPRRLACCAEGEKHEWIPKDGCIASPDSKLHDALQDAPEPTFHDGKWILIWGGATVTGFYIAQFAQLAGMRVVAVCNKAKHEKRLTSIGVEHVIDRSSPSVAVEEVRQLTQGRLEYAVDCVGKTTAAFAMQCLNTDPQTRVHLVGLSGLPKAQHNVELCEVPIKTFHTNPAVGNATMKLLTSLISEGKLVLPEVEVMYNGLESINDGLDRLREGKLEFGRIVIKM